MNEAAGWLDLSGKVAHVTGGARGIGAAIARALRMAGATVMLVTMKMVMMMIMMMVTMMVVMVVITMMMTVRVVVMTGMGMAGVAVRVSRVFMAVIVVMPVIMGAGGRIGRQMAEPMLHFVQRGCARGGRENGDEKDGSQSIAHRMSRESRRLIYAKCRRLFVKKRLINSVNRLLHCWGLIRLGC